MKFSTDAKVHGSEVVDRPSLHDIISSATEWTVDLDVDTTYWLCFNCTPGEIAAIAVLTRSPDGDDHTPAIADRRTLAFSRKVLAAWETVMAKRAPVMRAWAKEHGMAVNDRGRLPTGVRAQYLRATRQTAGEASRWIRMWNPESRS